MSLADRKLDALLAAALDAWRQVPDRDPYENDLWLAGMISIAHAILARARRHGLTHLPMEMERRLIKDLTGSLSQPSEEQKSPATA